MNMDIKERFRRIMEREHLNATAFAESIGVAASTISHILSGRNKSLSTDVILRLHAKYEDINLQWLITGEGNMSNSPLSSNDVPDDYPLFAQNAENPNISLSNPKNLKEMPLGQAKSSHINTDIQNLIHIQKPSRKITEIRIFFDDNTYEIFKPEK